MPEGPEVRITGQGLKIAIEGKQIVRITSEKPLAGFSDSVLPLLVETVWTHGKKIIARCRSLGDGRTHFFFSTLNMTGVWLHQPGKYTRTVLELGYRSENQIVSEQKVYYDDLRKFGKIRLLSESELKDELKQLGPDILAMTDHRPLLDHVRSQLPKRGKMRLAEALLDQSLFCGIGNCYRSDAMKLAELNPWRLLNSLTPEELERQCYFAWERLQVGLKCGGFSMSDYVRLDGSKGSYQPIIYGKRNTPSVLVEADKDNRNVFYAPEVQR